MAREQALKQFRWGEVDVLVATDVAARGIDVEGITHVINYQTPEDERPTSTASAGPDGPVRPVAVTLVDWDDLPPLEVDRQPSIWIARAPRDLLDLAAPLPRAGHPHRDPRLRRNAEEIAGEAHRIECAHQRRARTVAQQRPPAPPHPRWRVGDGPLRNQRQRRFDGSATAAGNSDGASGDATRARRRRRRPARALKLP